MTISLFPTIWETKTTDSIPFDIFLDNIRSGHWQDLVLPVRAIKDHEARQIAKKKIPSVTLSGMFPERVDSKIQSHSGFIGVDVDDLGNQVEATKSLLAGDPYVYAIFTSVSGLGLCVVMPIEGDRHRDAFAGIANYLLSKYNILVDPTAVNPSRARYVSYDPHIRVNTEASIFKKYLPKEKKKKQAPAIFVQTEFDEIVRQMVERNVACCDDYRDWLKVSFGLADHFGEGGRGYFHSLSACSNKYDADTCDKQYDHALRRKNKDGLKVTISTVYYYAKNAGINVASETTKKISALTTSLKKSGLDVNTIVKNLEKFEGIAPAESQGIVTQAFNSGVDYHGKDTMVDNLLAWLRHNYDLRRNAITRMVENNGKVLDDIGFNSIYIDAKRIFAELSFDLFHKCIMSNRTAEYNPFHEWYAANHDTPYNGEIEKYWSCFTTDDAEKLRDFGTRWLVSIIASTHGIHSPLFLLLAGEVHGKGKTSTFRELLPAAWREPVDYYAESKLDAGKDDDILMCKRILIMDDEFDGKSKSEQKRFKSITDKRTFSLREPYGRSHVDMKRLAVLGGTSQSLHVLSDPTGHRRIIPINILDVDWKARDAVDKTAMFAELYRMYNAGYVWRVFGDDMARLNANTEAFIDFSNEYELLHKYFEKPERDNGDWLTASEIKEVLEVGGQRTILNKIGAELKRTGYTQQIKRFGGRVARVWHVKRKGFGLPGASHGFDMEPPDFASEYEF
jgi:hypothetical protein